MRDEPQRPTNPEDRDRWNAYWTALGMPWRTEPEIDEERQAFLQNRRLVEPDEARNSYPFGRIQLGRADVEWLLATHENDGKVGPVDVDDVSQAARQSLDLRGAIFPAVFYPDVNLDIPVTLSRLPLARLQAGPSDEMLAWARFLSSDESGGAHFEGVSFEGADLRQACLNGAILTGAGLRGAVLIGATLSHAQLGGANLEGAYLEGVRADLADMTGV